MHVCPHRVTRARALGCVRTADRFKEHGRWAVDSDGYYSSTAARYLEVATLPSFATLDDERKALLNAFKIAAATGRIVILPAFNCHGCSVTGLGGTREACSGRARDRPLCTFSAHWDVKAFNAAQLPYREHYFRQSGRVPAGVAAGSGTAATVQLPKGRMSQRDVEAEFGGSRAAVPVIVVPNLNTVDVILDAALDGKLNNQLSKAFVGSSLRQYS